MKKKNQREKTNKGSLIHRVLTVAGIILGAVCLPVLTINLTLLVRSQTNPEEVPDFLGLSPIIVVTDSMDPVISAGDMIVVRKTDAENIQVGDIISYRNPQNEDSGNVITHRVIEIGTDEDGGICFRTKGDANNVRDPVVVPADHLVGVYRMSIPVLGNLALFMKSTVGMLLFVVLPLVLLVTYDLIRERAMERKEGKQKLRLSEAETEYPAEEFSRQATLPAEG